jgi:4-hydroxymandelate oxidase
MNITRREALRSASALAGSVVVPLSIQAQGGTVQAPPSADLSKAVNLFDFEKLAHERMTTLAWEYISGAAGDEITLRWNREASDRMALRTRVLVNVSQIDTRVTLFGHEVPFPILLAPTAYHKLVHPEGERATVRGAGAASATMVVSTLATTSIEDVAGAATAPLWFQLYVQKDRGLTRDLVQRAEGAGCKALCITVDTPVVGTRNREARVKFALPAGVTLENLKGMPSRTAGDHMPGTESIYSALLDPALTWNDIESIRAYARVPVLLKGILNGDDADRAVRAGVAGLIVSNHGARNLDTAPATLEALPEIVAKVAGRVPILVDGGIRRGTDVLKAIALGARAVLIGRPYLFGLSAGGADGVSQVINILRREFEVAMALTGRTTVAGIDKTVLWQR